MYIDQGYRNKLVGPLSDLWMWSKADIHTDQLQGLFLELSSVMYIYTEIQLQENIVLKSTIKVFSICFYFCGLNVSSSLSNIGPAINVFNLEEENSKFVTYAIFNISFQLCLFLIPCTIPKQKLTTAFMIWAKNSKFAVGHIAPRRSAMCSAHSISLSHSAEVCYCAMITMKNYAKTL